MIVFDKRAIPCLIRDNLRGVHCNRESFAITFLKCLLRIKSDRLSLNSTKCLLDCNDVCFVHFDLVELFLLKLHVINSMKKLKG